MPGMPQSIWTPRPVFPPSIFSRIIDLSADSTSSLQLCAVICHSWLTRCRFHIFAPLVLSSEKSMNRYVDLVRTNPLLATFARSLRVHQSHPEEEDISWPTLIPVLLGRLLGTLQVLEFACPLVCVHPSFFASITQLRAVTSLSISGPIFLTFSGFTRLVSSFPSLSHLRANLDGISGWENRPVLSKHPVSRLHLVVLEVRDTDGHLGDLTDWLLETPTTTSLHTLWFEFKEEEQIEPISRLIARCELLQKLTLNLTSGDVLSPQRASKSRS